MDGNFWPPLAQAQANNRLNVAVKIRDMA